MPRPARLRGVARPLPCIRSRPGPRIGPGRGHRATHGQTYTPWAGQTEEIRALRPPAREWFLEGYARLGPPGLDDGAAADFMVYDRDPATDLHVVDHPAHVVLGGRLVSPAQLILDGLTATPEWVICAQQNALKAQLSAVHTRR